MTATSAGCPPPISPPPSPRRRSRPSRWSTRCSRASIRQGTLDQMRKDLEALQSLGAAYVLLDSAGDDPQATRHHEPAWRMLATLADRVLDLPQQTLR